MLFGIIKEKNHVNDEQISKVFMKLVSDGC